MMRPTLRAAKKRWWLAGLVAASLALALSACEAPPHAAVVKCSGSNLSDVAVKKDCTVTIEKFDRQASASIKVKTKRRQAFVTGHFTVQQGTVRIELRGNTGTKAEVIVSPGHPGSVESTLRLNKQNSSFRLRFHPEGEVAGLDGQVSYEAR
ncbi:hypothetical protein [Lysobacter sp. A289]